MRMPWPRRVFAQVLAIQLALAACVVGVATALFIAAFSRELDEQAMGKALAIAKAVAVDPAVERTLRTSVPSGTGPVQREAEQIRQATGALYVVVMDTSGIRWSHPSPSYVGLGVATDASRVLAGQEVTQIGTSSLGPSVMAKAPVFDAYGRIVGAVSVGFAYDTVRSRLLSAVPGLLACAGAALGAGALAALPISRRILRRAHDLAFKDISRLLNEREAMLGGLREGVLAVDAAGRVRLVNDEAQRLLGLGPEAAGRPLEEVVGPGRLRSVLTGAAGGADLLAPTGARILVANRMPTRDGGAVVTLRDRTEVEQLGRELDAIHGLTDALRAQEHEHANRMHTLLGLLEIDRPDQAAAFLTELTGARRATIEQVTGQIQDPLVAAQLVGMASIAAERRIELRLSPDSRLPDRVVDPSDLVTILGNLVDNAFEALARRLPEQPFVEVDLAVEQPSTVVLRVSDNGPGVPPELSERVFAPGWTTGEAPGRPHRQGLGLTFVRQLAERHGGTAEVTPGPGGGAQFTVVLPEALSAGAFGPDRPTEAP
ncbi:sensor histidine kinase [Streptomyces sp. NPDC089919]|uniref:sensor histidine kinase n=1 Tax=Streptomyces sp. NPDC089919 TaxID=3155188 RepID=UPI003441D0A9